MHGEDASPMDGRTNFVNAEAAEEAVRLGLLALEEVGSV